MCIRDSIYTNLAPKSLSHQQDVKYPDISTNTYVLDAMSTNTDSNYVRTYGVGGYGGYEGIVAMSASSSSEQVAMEPIGFFDSDVVHLAPTSLECDSTIKYPRRIQ